MDEISSAALCSRLRFKTRRILFVEDKIRELDIEPATTTKSRELIRLPRERTAA